MVLTKGAVNYVFYSRLFYYICVIYYYFIAFLKFEEFIKFAKLKSMEFERKSESMYFYYKLIRDKYVFTLFFLLLNLVFNDFDSLENAQNCFDIVKVLHTKCILKVCVIYARQSG